MNLMYYITAGVMIFVSFCKTYEKIPQKGCYQIEGIEGPEDFSILDSSHLLISSLNRRIPKEGNLYKLNIHNHEIQKIERINEPENFKFYPLGIDIHQEYVFVVLQSEIWQTNYQTNGIVIYKWENGKLKFIKEIHHPYIYSPNDLKIINENEFVVTNDMKNRSSFLEAFASLYFGTKKGSAVYCNLLENQCKWIDIHLGYPNSVAFNQQKLYISTTFEGKIYEYDMTEEKEFINKKVFSEVEGADNLIFYDNYLYVSSHPDLFKFIKHSKNTNNKSPSQGYRIQIHTKEKEKIFSDDGSRISAGSVIVKIQNQIYLGQVFDPFLLKCE